MRQLLRQTSQKEALIVAHFLQRVWREIDERYL